MTHWSFLDEDGPKAERLCGKLLLIADNDGAEPDSAKGKRHAKLTATLKENFCLLPVREIENLLTPSSLRDVLIAYGESPENLQIPNQEDYANRLLGEFIDGLMFISKKSRNASYASDSGTVNGKPKFCENALRTMTTFEGLSEAAKELSIRVFKFINDQNQRSHGR